MLFFWSCWPPETFETSAGRTSTSFLGFRTCTLRTWNPRPACGTAFTSVRISMSVFGFVPTRDEPAECLPWTRRTGVRPCFLCSGNVRAHSGQQLANAVRRMIYVSFLEFQAGLCLHVTAAVKGGSLRASRTWSQRPKLVQGSLEPVGALGAHTSYTLQRGRSS